MATKIKSYINTGRTYGKIHFSVFEHAYDKCCSISAPPFFIPSLPSGLTEREAQIALKAFCEGYDKGARDVELPEKAYKKIAREQRK